MIIVGRAVLIDTEQNLWGFEMQTDKGPKMLSDKHYSSSIAVALDEIASALGEETIPEGKLVRITIEGIAEN